MSGESIYSWIKAAPEVPPKEPLHTSAHAPLAAPSASTFRSASIKKPTGSMGRSVKHTVRPDEFRKSSAEANKKWKETLPPAYTRTRQPVKAPVPLRTEVPKHGLSSGKDFVVHNAVEAILAVPRARGKDVDDWLAKPDYGKVPEYLATVKAHIAAEHEFVQRMLDQRQMEEAVAAGTAVRELPEDERESLLSDLKTKWAEVNAAYQTITFRNISTHNSTLGEIRFKESCEQQLDQIEKDIKRLSVKAPIFIVD
jgi:hypothetical protein